jgi:hypothetical protein
VFILYNLFSVHTLGDLGRWSHEGKLYYTGFDCLCLAAKLSLSTSIRSSLVSAASNLLSSYSGQRDEKAETREGK